MAKILAASLGDLFFDEIELRQASCQNCFARGFRMLDGLCQARIWRPPYNSRPNVVRPKSSTVSATRSPFPKRSQNILRGGTNISRKRQPCRGGSREFRTWAIRASSTSKPFISGVTRKRGDPCRRGSCGSGVRAMTVST